MIIFQESEGTNPRGTIEFDEYERNRYVSRFLAVLKSQLSDKEMCEQVYQIHLEICAKHDLYIAVFDRLEWRHKCALRGYVQYRGKFPE